MMLVTNTYIYIYIYIYNPFTLGVNLKSYTKSESLEQINRTASNSFVKNIKKIEHMID